MRWAGSIRRSVPQTMQTRPATAVRWASVAAIDGVRLSGLDLRSCVLARRGVRRRMRFIGIPFEGVVVRRHAPDAPPRSRELAAPTDRCVRVLASRDRRRVGAGLLLVFWRLDARGRIQLALPEGLGRRWAGLRRGRGSPAFHQCLEVGASHPDAPADPQRRKRSLVDPVFQSSNRAHPDSPRARISAFR